LVQILQDYPDLLKASLSCILPYLEKKKIFTRILNKVNKGTFSPKRRFRIKIARLLVKYKISTKNLLKRKPQTKEANFIDSKSNVECAINGQIFICCADIGAHNSIISNTVFQSLQLDSSQLDTKQSYNIRTATSTVTDAVLGQIVLQLTFHNAGNKNKQFINQSFLVLRPDYELEVPLLGTDFLGANAGEIKFQPNFKLFLNKKEINSTFSAPANIPKTCTTNARYQESSIMSSNCFPSAQPETEPLDISPGAQEDTHTTIHEFCAFVYQARFEKVARLVRNEHKHKKTPTLDVYKIICENYDDEYNNLLQRQSMMPEEDSTPANPELKVDIDHLDPDIKRKFLSIKNKYPQLYSTHKHHVGRFTGFTAEANIDPKINCRQKQCGRFLPKSAKVDLNAIF
jgi:hypothetical protein